jgi:cell division protein FtsQ
VITRTKNITETEIKEILPFKIGDNFLRINLSKSELEIERLKPELKNVVINRGWRRINVNFCERIPEAFIVSSGKMFGVDFDNKPFQLHGLMNMIKVPKIFYKSNSERIKLLNFIKRFKIICNNDYIKNILKIKFNDEKDLIFVTRDNVYVIWGKDTQECMASKFRKYKEIYSNAMSKYKLLEYIDMSLYDFGKIIVKPYYCD